VSLFQCDKCGCVENTALGHYHTRNWAELWPDEVLGKALCSECMPTKFRSGETCEKGGKWHGRFEKRCYPLGSLYTDDVGNVRRKSDNKHPSEDES
jgi:hypothetical protein